MGRRNELGWEHLVLICIAIVAIIWVFKVLFLISAITIVVATGWLVINFVNKDHEHSLKLLAVILVGLIVAVVSYQIGYGFEKSDIGKPVVESAKTIVEADNNINQAMDAINNQLIDATISATK